MRQNKTAGFWTRLASRLTDICLFATLSLGLAYLLLKRTNGGFKFASAWEFYLWSITSLFLLFGTFVLAPLFLKGQTLGMKLFKIQIIFKNRGQKFVSLLKRELFFAIAWMFNLVILLVIINHSLINKISGQQSGVQYSTFESARIAIFTTFGSAFVIIQWVLAFSIMIRKDKVGIHDQMSKTKVVYKNKFELVSKQAKVTSFRPFAIQNKAVEWVDDV